MKQLPPQFVSILAIYCFCMLQIPSSGFPRPLADPPDDLDIMQLEWLAYGATLSWQTKHYSRTQEPTHPVKSGFPPVRPLMRLATQLANRKMKRFQQQRDSRTDAGDFTKKDHTATLGRPFFLFRKTYNKRDAVVGSADEWQFPSSPGMKTYSGNQEISDLILFGSVLQKIHTGDKLGSGSSLAWDHLPAPTPHYQYVQLLLCKEDPGGAISQE
ncbi:neuromedin-S [Puma concolor]|uniref:Neuromedin-S n=1 Tax=Puma concolor TaxID=9696 RepID=A0A6P6IJY9_PUMCO|nr:neuromedin-S [Puma concolor]